MSRRFAVVVVLAAVVAAWSPVGTAGAGEKVPLEKVPPAAVKTVKDRFPKAEIRYVDKEPTGDYEFAMKEGSRQFDVGVTGDGKLLNVKEEIPEEQLPKAVKEGVQKKFPGAKFVEIEKVTSGDGDAAKVTFEMVLRTEKGRQAVRFDSSGNLLSDAK